MKQTKLFWWTYGLWILVAWSGVVLSEIEHARLVLAERQLAVFRAEIAHRAELPCKVAAPVCVCADQVKGWMPVACSIGETYTCSQAVSNWKAVSNGAH